MNTTIHSLIALLVLLAAAACGGDVGTEATSEEAAVAISGYRSIDAFIDDFGSNGEACFEERGATSCLSADRRAPLKKYGRLPNIGQDLFLCAETARGDLTGCFPAEKYTGCNGTCTGYGDCGSMAIECDCIVIIFIDDHANPPHGQCS